MSDIELHNGGVAAVGSRSGSKRICSPRLTCEFAPCGPIDAPVLGDGRDVTRPRGAIAIGNVS
jgi:hypothetical protein